MKSKLHAKNQLHMCPGSGFKYIWWVGGVVGSCGWVFPSENTATFSANLQDRFVLWAECGNNVVFDPDIITDTKLQVFILLYIFCTVGMIPI